MAIDAKFFMHDSDRVALSVLKAIPGFSQLFRAFMKVWSERQFRIQNMSTNLRISENQLPKYYHMLLPICEKLGIAVPDLYLTLDVNPNAYTAGDNEPFIVVTSGLLETLPDELIPSVLAHECGHIACHHCLYSTMGRIILGKTADLLGLDGIKMLPIQAAFSYWMRCSEFSADRAAALCDGNSDKVVETMLRFSGFDKDVLGEVNVEEFMDQAVDYQQMIQDSLWDRTLEFLMLTNMDHPLNAVRARECYEWANTERFSAMRDYMNANDEAGLVGTYLKEVPVTGSAKHFVGDNVQEVEAKLRSMGFANITLVKSNQKGILTKIGDVTKISIDGDCDFDKYTWHPVDAQIVIEYYDR